MGRKTRLTPELIEAIAKRIRLGSYPYIAAAACGIPRSTYYGWMQKAEQKGSRPIYRQLRDRISEAAASARVSAEVRVFRDNPFQWLRYGPGRDKPGEPGWTETPRTLKLEGDITTTQEESRPEVPLETLQGGLAVLEQLGIIKILPCLPPPEDDGTGGDGGPLDQIDPK